MFQSSFLIFYFILFFSNESGRDNPFRPDGDISKEADEIVQKIKSGQPLEIDSQRPAGEDLTDDTHSPSSPARGESSEPLIESPITKDNSYTNKQQQQQEGPQQNEQPSLQAPQKSGANGSAAPPDTSPGPVEIKHGTVTPSEPAQVEHVVLKKKNKCSCCVIQ